MPQINIRPDITVAMAVDAYKRTGKYNAAAAELGCNEATVRRRVKQNIPAGHMPPPDGHAVKGISTLYDGEGNVTAQWVKTQAEGLTIEQQALIVREVFAESKPIQPIPLRKAAHRTDLMAVYPIGDHHLGMYAWAQEAGADYDLKIAQELLEKAFTHLIDVTPATETALIVNVGDFFHVDTLDGTTARSSNTLDVDTRHAAMIRAGVAVLRIAIELALTRHPQVKVICTQGNHDDLGALWLSLALSLLYERNPRVEIEQSPSKFVYHQHGKVLIGVTHGDTVKLEQLGGIMATDRPQAWGTTAHRYWLTGHIHQRKVLELPGVLVESFRTLAARDAWATAAGYRSGRDMMSLVFHAEHGEVARHRFDVSMAA